MTHFANFCNLLAVIEAEDMAAHYRSCAESVRDDGYYLAWWLTYRKRADLWFTRYVGFVTGYEPGIDYA